jgi:trk system potassium uptake protein TrkA
MKSLIIGGGKVGYYLLKTLVERGYIVTLVERDEYRCKEIAEDIDADIICGDGTEIDVLRDAGMEDADIVAAVTGTDEENLVICEIAKLSFRVNRTIARVNNPKNIKIFKALGVDKIVCSTEVIANLIECEFECEDYRVVQIFERGEMTLVEFAIPSEKHVWANKKVKNLELPGECVIASIIRGENVIFPRGESDILVGDKILVLTNKTAFGTLKKYLHIGGNCRVFQ